MQLDVQVINLNQSLQFWMDGLIWNVGSIVQQSSLKR